MLIGDEPNSIKPTAIIKKTNSTLYKELFIKDIRLNLVLGDSGSAVLSYSPDLRAVSLSDILSGGDNQVTTV
ncbi:29838_t:CDS:2, partial [Racocetra persica]